MTFIGACFVKRRRSCNWSFKLILLFLNTVIIAIRDADFVNIILYYFLLLCCHNSLQHTGISRYMIAYNRRLNEL